MSGVLYGDRSMHCLRNDKSVSHGLERSLVVTRYGAPSEAITPSSLAIEWFLPLSQGSTVARSTV